MFIVVFKVNMKFYSILFVLVFFLVCFVYCLNRCLERGDFGDYWVSKEDLGSGFYGYKFG